jgi:hypothetical protein
LTFGAGQAHFDLAVEVVLVSGALAVLEGLLGSTTSASARICKKNCQFRRIDISGLELGSEIR